MATALFLAVFVATVILLPEMPFWVYLLMIPLFYKIQSWSHKVWTASADMTEFDKRFPKGRVLFVVLLINEVPICLNCVLFGSRYESVRKGVRHRCRNGPEGASHNGA